MTEPIALDLVQGLDRATALLNPLRLRVLRELRSPDSAAGLSRKLGIPRQKLNYHLRELEQAGFLELQEERRKGNCTERVLRVTARSYLVDPRLLGELGVDREDFADRFSATHLVALAARAIRDLAILRERAASAGKRLPTLSLSAEVRFASAEKQSAFAAELSREVERLAAKYHDETSPRGRRFRVLAAAYPAVREEAKS